MLEEYQVVIVVIIVVINLFQRQTCSQDEGKDLYQKKHMEDRRVEITGEMSASANRNYAVLWAISTIIFY